MVKGYKTLNMRRAVAPVILTGGCLGIGCQASDETASAAVPANDAEKATSTAPATLPAFEDYPVKDVFQDAPAEVDLNSADYGPLYRTVLRDVAATGPDFAGRYTVVQWGCGTGCQVNAVVDARTGELSEQTLVTQNGVAYRLDSALLIADPVRPGDSGECCGFPAAYLWRNGQFEEVGEGKHPHLGQQLVEEVEQ